MALQENHKKQELSTTLTNLLQGGIRAVGPEGVMYVLEGSDPDQLRLFLEVSGGKGTDDEIEAVRDLGEGLKRIIDRSSEIDQL